MFKGPAGTGYLLRRGVPADARQDFVKVNSSISSEGITGVACRKCERLACETTDRIAAARSGLQRLRKNPHSGWEGLEVPAEVTQEVEDRFFATVFATTEVVDIEPRDELAIGGEPALVGRARGKRGILEAVATGSGEW
jgi:hypothetical protein